MSVSYVSVQWNRHKRVYDTIATAGVAAFVAVFVLTSQFVQGSSAPTIPVLLLRALGVCAIVLLHIILTIGPLARLTPLAAPLLYNRRHLGVLTFLVGLAHASLATLYYGAFGDRNPVLVLLGTNAAFSSISGFPFEVLGLAALLVLFLMAATSHDFWLKNLGAPLWKNLHMAVYGAYALLIAHVLLGSLRSEPSLVPRVMLWLGILLVGSLHIAAGLRSRVQLRAQARTPEPDGWIDVCAVPALIDCRARTVRTPQGDSIAVFRYEGKVSAVANTCVHQGGPLGEGKVVGGCVTCPWHGYQYLPDCGQSPPPFTERIATYEVRIRGDRVMVRASANPPGTPVPPAILPPEPDPE